MDVTLQATAAAAEGAVTSFNPNDKYIGLALAISSSAAIGTSFIITKKGLISAADSHEGFSSESYSYLKNGLWWAGMLTMVVGEVANFAAYTFAPPALVTPLGALSVLVGAVLAAIFLGERLGKIGISGCSLCLVGSIIVVLHAPEDKDIATVDEILEYALQPGFMFYAFFVTCFSLYMIYKVAPKHGNKNPLVYLSICSFVGSISVMAVKGLGIALKLTFAGNNQLWRAGTWIFAITVAGCIAIQTHYFNMALHRFPTNVTSPIYYVAFTTATLTASMILFTTAPSTDDGDWASLACGLYVTSIGVLLINASHGGDGSNSDYIPMAPFAEEGIARLSHDLTNTTPRSRAEHAFIHGAPHPQATLQTFRQAHASPNADSCPNSPDLSALCSPLTAPSVEPL